MSVYSRIREWWGGSAIAEKLGLQNALPASALTSGTTSIGVDGALQISTVWACIDRRATLLASLPCYVYMVVDGEKTLARLSRLWALLHVSPNSRMTPFEFWRTMLMNYDLRGNAYARIDRDKATGEALALWPMPATQVEAQVQADGSMLYTYRIGDSVMVLAENSVLHLKNLGNGTTGMEKLEFMRATLDEAAKAQESAGRIFGNGGKPTGILMVDRALDDDQRAAVVRNFADLAVGSVGRIHLLEASMKYQQLSLSPVEQQLLETRNYGVEEICRWFDVPPVLVHHANVTAWGSGIEQIVQGFYTLAARPMIVNMEQALFKRVMTAQQRATMAIEFGLDALMRANAKDRLEGYAKAVQNGWMTRAEVRQLEGSPYMPGTDQLTAQSNLVPLEKLGVAPTPTPAPAPAPAPASGGDGSTIAQ